MILLVGILLAACTGQATGAPTVDVAAVMTSGVETFVAGLTQTQAALPTATETPSPTITNSPIPSDTLVALPTWTPVPLYLYPTIIPSATGTQYTPTVDPSSLAAGCNNLRLIADVTVPSGTIMQPKEKFTKTWKVENNGTCDWVYLYRLVYAGGERMKNDDPPTLGKVIPPGKWTQLSVNLNAPDTPGTYTGSWRLGDQVGTPFGATLTVSIVVANSGRSYP